MLPKFPDVTDVLLERMQNVMLRARDARMSHFQGARHIECFEGDSHGHQSNDEIPFREYCDEVFFSKSEIISLTQMDIIQKFEQAGTNLGAQIADHHFEKIRTACEAIESTGDQDGLEALIEQVLQAMQRVRWSFDKHGSPEGMTFIAGPAMAERLSAANEIIENSTELCRRKRSIIEQKREEWRASQANRKLVD